MLDVNAAPCSDLVNAYPYLRVFNKLSSRLAVSKVLVNGKAVWDLLIDTLGKRCLRCGFSENCAVV